MSKTVTRNIEISVLPAWLPERSNLANSEYFFVYQIQITNLGDDTVQLINRHWDITDGNGKLDQIDGPGVVGRTPTLKRGDQFEYTSACPLPTPQGSMGGWFEMVGSDGDPFNALIEPFFLDANIARN
jgi:ApaG protein